MLWMSRPVLESSTSSSNCRTSLRPTLVAHKLKLVVKTGAMPYVFEPANITAERGDTLRFVDEANVPHDVHFESHPAGAKLGAATVSPYLTTTGQTYDVVIDARFTDGKYKFVCDPHEMLGMRGTLTIEERTVASHSIK